MIIITPAPGSAFTYHAGIEWMGSGWEKKMHEDTAPRIAAVAATMMTPEQQSAADVVTAGPRGGVRGPFAVLLNSPGAFSAAQGLGAYLRFQSALPANLRELAILTTARHWHQDYEWRIHAAIAQEAGVSERAIESLAAGGSVQGLSPEESIVHAFCHQLHRTNDVDNATFSAAERLLEPAGVIDLCAVCGYYALLAMVMNVARNPVPVTPSPFAD
ncbi:MAG: carboxymuconolactone decarboxylase family protein [Azospirillaceae bacterium]|nr:carboxymuconolactone decarboxylase family protein [Azospirillaceae bacterium]